MDKNKNDRKRNRIVSVDEFKGMETTVDSSKLGIDVADMARNVSWDTDGGISKREGTKVFKSGTRKLDYFINREVGIVDKKEIDFSKAGTLRRGEILRDLKNTNLDTLNNKDPLKAHTLLYRDFVDNKLKIKTKNGTEDFEDIDGDSISYLFDILGVENLDDFVFTYNGNDSKVVIDNKIYNVLEMEGEHSTEENVYRSLYGKTQYDFYVSITESSLSNLYISSTQGTGGALYSIEQSDEFGGFEYIHRTDNKTMWASIKGSRVGENNERRVYILPPGVSMDGEKRTKSISLSQWQKYIKPYNYSYNAYYGYPHDITQRPTSKATYDGSLSYQNNQGTAQPSYNADGTIVTPQFGTSGPGGLYTSSLNPIYPGTVPPRTDSFIIPPGTNVGTGTPQDLEAYITLQVPEYEISNSGTYDVGGYEVLSYAGGEVMFYVKSDSHDIFSKGEIPVAGTQGDINITIMAYIDGKWQEKTITSHIYDSGSKPIIAWKPIVKDDKIFVYVIEKNGTLESNAHLDGIHTASDLVLRRYELNPITYEVKGSQVMFLSDFNLPKDTGNVKFDFEVSGLNDNASNIISIEPTDVENIVKLKIAFCERNTKTLGDDEYKDIKIYTLEFNDGPVLNQHSALKCSQDKKITNFISPFYAEEYLNNINRNRPRIYYNSLDDLYIISNNSLQTFVNTFKTGVIELSGDGEELFSTKIKPGTSYGEFKFDIYDKDLNKIGNTITYPDSSDEVEMPDIVKDKKIKFIVHSGSTNNYLLKDLTIFKTEKVTNQSIEIKNAIKNGEKIIGEKLDLLIEFYSDKTVNFFSVDKTKKVPVIQKIDVIGPDWISNLFTIKGNILDWTYMRDSIIVSTDESAYVFTVAQGKNEKYVYVNDLFSMADKISYQQAVNNGLNILSQNPLDISKKWSESVGPSIYFEDIIISQKDGSIALVIEPGKTYDILPQIYHTKTEKQDWVTYEYKLSHLDLTNYNWTDKTSSLIKKDVTPATLGPFTDNGEYRLEITATITYPPNADGSPTPAPIVLEKNITFNVESKNINYSLESKSIVEEIKKCKYVTTLEGRLAFYGNGTRNIYTSENEYPFYFTADEIVRADAFGKSEELISINAFKDTQVIFTETTMMSMTRRYQENGESFWSVLPLDDVIGAITHRSVCPVENTLAFVSYGGVYVIGQISVAEKRVQLINISQQVTDLTDVFDKTDIYNPIKVEGINSINIEKRILISFPEKNYVMVYDYNNARDINSGKWALWDGILPKLMTVINDDLYFIQDSINNFNDGHIYKKNKRIYLDLHEQKEDSRLYYSDANDGKVSFAIKFEYESKSSSVQEEMSYKKIKRISITTDNSFLFGTNYTVSTKNDNIDDWNDLVKNIVHKRANINGGAFLYMDQTNTGYRKKNIINTISHMKANKGMSFSIKIVNNSNGPISIKRVYIEYTTSSPKRFRIKNTNLGQS